MSTNDGSTAEAGQSDQNKLPATHHQYYRYYNKQTPTKLHQQQQQQQQQCLHYIPASYATQSDPPHNHNTTTKWLPQQATGNSSGGGTGDKGGAAGNGDGGGNSNSGEFDEFHWHQNLNKQHNNIGANNYNINARSSNSNSNNIGGVGSLGGGSKVYITPADIPTPPPHPANSIGGGGSGVGVMVNKRYKSNSSNEYHQHQQPPHQHHYNQQQQPLPPPAHRCKCEHPIEVLRSASHKHQQHYGHDGDDYEDGVITADGHNHHQQHHHQHHYHQQQSSSSSTAAAASSRQYHYTTTHAPYLKQHLQRGPLKSHDGFSGFNDETGGANNHHHHHHRFQNLVYSKEKIRRIRIILSVVAAILVIGLLAVALVFIIGAESLGPDNPSPDNAIDLEDVLTSRLYAKRFNGSWTAPGNIIYRDNGTIVEYDIKTKNITTLLSNAHHYVLSEKSADGKFLLLAKNYKKNFRFSFIAEYDIYNISNGQVHPLTIQNEQRSLLMVQWAPVGNGLIINYERNLYYKPSALEAEITITTDDNAAILNGIPDWVYEEEVFSSNVATWFNSAGTQIAFIRFDDSPTHVINFPYYGDAGDLRYQYPFNHLIAYPKAGSSNPRVQLFTADLARAANGASNFITEIPVPSALNTETDYIITAVTWLDNTNVLSIWMNRIQNLAYLQVFQGLRRYEIFNMESKTGWIELFTTPFKNRDGSRIALILPQLQSNGDSYEHLSLLSTTSLNSKAEALTKGKYVVESILHWDTTYDVIFYTANTEQNPETMHIYAIKAATDQTPKCLSCKLHISGGVEQNYYSADFNSKNQVIITSIGPGIPMVVVYDWIYEKNQVTLKKILDWESNEVLRTNLKGISLPTTEIHEIPIAGGFFARVLLQLPPKLDRSGKTKYPMLVDVYGGPASSSVVNRWNLDWGSYLSSNQSVIYAKIDGRGSGLRGQKLLHSIYLKLGTVEIADQIDVAQKLQEKFDFIDAKHTGIWGWSYGGYAAAMALANDDNKVFKCAASVAPVTDWTYYDSIYTERYMALPKTNEIGYANSRLSTRAQKLRGKKYMLIHGTLDDNVHYQQTMILAKNLERHDILFKQISYTDEDHGLANVRPHLYHSLDRFFGECFSSSRLMISAK